MNLINQIDSQFDILDYAPVGMLVLRSDFTVIFWNRCLAEWTGIERDDILDTDIRNRFPHLRKPIYAARIKDIFKGAPPIIFSSQLHKHILPCLLCDEQYRIQHTTVSSIPIPDSSDFYALFDIQDVTDLTRTIKDYQKMRDQALEEVKERKRAEIQLQSHQENLARSNKELEDFAYVVSHDLKAPLRGISNLSGWIAEDYSDVLDGKGKEHLHLLGQKCNRMRELISGILEVSKVGQNKQETKNVDLNQLVRSVIDLIDIPENVEVNVEDRLPSVTCVKVRISQVIQNLLSNAIKFIDKPTGEIRFGCAEKDGYWEFICRDNGKGIESVYFEKIFKLFETLPSNDNKEGTGVGLALVKKIVARHGGDVWVESMVDQGSTFYFTLPKASNEHSAEAQRCGE